MGFLPSHAFFIFCDAAKTSAAFTLRAWLGQIATQRMHEMQAFSSVFAGLCGSMAFTGHLSAQRPQPVHALPALGFIGTPP